MDQENIDKLLGENLKLMRNYNYLKKTIILLIAEKDERETKIKIIENDFNNIQRQFSHLQKSYDNIKTIHNHLSYENSILVSKFKKLEDLVLLYAEDIKIIDEILKLKMINKENVL